MVVKLSGCFRPVIFGPGVKVASLGFSGEAGIFWICWFPHGILINYMQFWCVYKCIPASSKGFCLDPRDGVWAPLIIHSAPFGRSRYIYIFMYLQHVILCLVLGTHSFMTQGSMRQTTKQPARSRDTKPCVKPHDKMARCPKCTTCKDKSMKLDSDTVINKDVNQGAIAYAS